jgi:octaheme c-type cytochrome (tetrathionate reductase family)
MKAKLRAFRHTALSAVAALLLLPAAIQAAGTESREFAAGEPLSSGPGGMSAQDFIEYASVNDEDIHELYFSVILYEGTQSCLMCHQDQGQQALDMGHFKWQGKSENMVGFESGEFGKNQLLNNFCIAVPTNEGRCTQCHAGYGYDHKSYDFTDPTNVDCLVCHDQTGTYAKDLKTAGMPVPGIDLNLVAQSVDAVPQRKNCIGCHAKAGGGDNVKHGDISTDLIATTREYDVHMGTDGGDMKCVACHGTNHDPKDGSVNHGNAGMSLHSVHEGEMKVCTDCHGQQQNIHAGTEAESMIGPGWHERLACQTCHIPAIARKISTKVEWYWSDAGQNVDPIPVDPDTGRPEYDKKKGSFKWENNVRPVLRYSNGKWDRKLIGADDNYTTEPIELAVPQGDYNDPEAMIYPFKLMVGNQPVDPNTRTILVPHLFGKKGGANPYWGKFDWNLALQDGADYTGQDYSGEYAFAATEMLLSVNHEIAPAAMALGAGPSPEGCMDCHTTGYVDWTEIGWTDDPFNGGQRVSASPSGSSAGAVRLD